jgi:hypothetical protein
MADYQILLQKRIEQRIKTYRNRYTNPSKTTIRRWQSEAKRELSNRNQLSLPLVFQVQNEIEERKLHPEVEGIMNQQEKPEKTILTNNRQV